MARLIGGSYHVRPSVRARVLAALDQWGHSTVDQVATTAAVSRSHALDTLDALVDAGELERRDTAAGPRYWRPFTARSGDTTQPIDVRDVLPPTRSGKWRATGRRDGVEVVRGRGRSK